MPNNILTVILGKIRDILKQLGVSFQMNDLVKAALCEEAAVRLGKPA